MNTFVDQRKITVTSPVQWENMKTFWLPSVQFGDFGIIEGACGKLLLRFVFAFAGKPANSFGECRIVPEGTILNHFTDSAPPLPVRNELCMGLHCATFYFNASRVVFATTRRRGCCPPLPLFPPCRIFLTARRRLMWPNPMKCKNICFFVDQSLLCQSMFLWQTPSRTLFVVIILGFGFQRCISTILT